MVGSRSGEVRGEEEAFRGGSWELLYGDSTAVRVERIELDGGFEEFMVFIGL